MQAVVLKCPLGGQFHFGKIALDVDTSLDETSAIFHSDALFSAIIQTVERLWGEAERFIKFFEDGVVSISSCFHCLEKADGEFIWFLPKPIHFNILEKLDDNNERKKLSKIHFISKKVWEMGLKPSQWKGECLILQKEFVLHKSELPEIVVPLHDSMKIYEVQSLPKVSTHKPSKEDSIYFQTNVQLATNRKLLDKKNLNYEELRANLPKVHYYFLLDYIQFPDEEEQEEITNKIETAIRILADSGIGGERSVGCGKLNSVEFIDDFEMEVDEGKYWCSLSLLNPLPEEMSHLMYWKMITRGGRRISKSQVLTNTTLPEEYIPKIKRVKMLEEGALLTEAINGQVVPIPEPKYDSHHKRSGKGFSLPVHPDVYP